MMNSRHTSIRKMHALRFEMKSISKSEVYTLYIKGIRANNVIHLKAGFTLYIFIEYHPMTIRVSSHDTYTYR